MSKFIEEEIENLQKFLDNKFEKYSFEKPELDELIKKYELSELVEDKINKERFLSFHLGRTRCYNIMKLSRQDTITNHKIYKENQKKAYEDLNVAFSELGFS